MERDRHHLQRAVALSGGHRAGPYLSWAETVSVGAQDRQEFDDLLGKALAVDPDAVKEVRVANLISQKRARWLLARRGDLFVE